LFAAPPAFWQGWCVPQNRDVSQHILPTAATMVGVCVTVIGIVRVLEVNGAISTVIDDILAFDGLIFLGSTFLSYASLRVQEPTPRLERLADLLFLGGLGCMVAASFMLTYELGQTHR
jgi:hypothetical protein